MDIKEYIASGILEFYVYGSLSTKENEEVYQILQEYPEAVKEVEQIEESLQKLSGSIAPDNLNHLFLNIKDQIIAADTKTIPITKRSSNWVSYMGWAASIALLIGLFLQFNKNKELRQKIVKNTIEKQLLEGKINVAEEDLIEAKSLLKILRSKDILQIPLQAQQIDPNAYATVYWDKEKQTTYIDVAGLPDPPSGKVYQVWSLTLNPLTPTSLGTLEQFMKDQNKIFALENPNESEAFGITLEPEGGSKTPTLEMLYTLGTVDS